MITTEEILSMAREAGLIQFSCDQNDGYIRDGVYVVQLAKFFDLAVASERAARIEAQTRLAELQEQVARSGLAHRKTVQEAVCEARKDALNEAMNACLNLQPPESCTRIEKSLWSIAMMQCANEIENLMGAV